MTYDIAAKCLMGDFEQDSQSGTENGVLDAIDVLTVTGQTSFRFFKFISCSLHFFFDFKITKKTNSIKRYLCLANQKYSET